MYRKIFEVGLIVVSGLIMCSIALIESTALLASSKGLKPYLTVGV